MPSRQKPSEQICWEYSALGKCFLTPCRFRHECSASSGTHYSTLCLRGGAFKKNSSRRPSRTGGGPTTFGCKVPMPVCLGPLLKWLALYLAKGFSIRCRISLVIIFFMHELELERVAGTYSTGHCLCITSGFILWELYPRRHQVSFD